MTKEIYYYKLKSSIYFLFLIFKGVFKILSQTHKLVARKIHNIILEKYNLNLNIDKLQWGSIAPDILPYYKLKRHYKEESLDYISKEIIALIYLYRYANLNDGINKLLLNHLSKKIGIISHYLCDYTCFPHAYRMTFVGNMKSHMIYESDLNIYSANHEFKEINLPIDNLKIENESKKLLQVKIKNYIDKIVESYVNNRKGFSDDLDYGLKLSSEISCFIIEVILNYSEDMQYQFI
ncbi:MAG: zinc dependent phospholipase C family protein [Peptoniphilaceae bacterium]